MKKLLICIAATAFICTAAGAQNFLDRLGNTAKNAFENNINQKVNKGVNDVLDGNFKKNDNKNNDSEVERPQKQQKKKGWTCAECGTEGNAGKFCNECGAKKPAEEGKADWKCPECGHRGNTGKFCGNCGAKKPDGSTAQVANPEAGKAQAGKMETAFAKSDFVPGDEIFFDDPVENEKLGEYPLHWDYLGGEECEIATLNGEQVIKLSGWYTTIAPLMKEAEYLPEDFTIEFDVWSKGSNGDSNNNWVKLSLDNENYEEAVAVTLNPDYSAEHSDVGCTYYTPAGDIRQADAKGDLLVPLIRPNSWLHVAVSFNKRAFKYYVAGVRMLNIPNVMRPTKMRIVSASADEPNYMFIKNIRIAKGAVPLYDRLMSDGKIVTYAITFDTGKATLKPESLVEINRVAKLMKENPNLSFEVQGHCDAQGSDKVNDPLSQKRAEAIVDALVEAGIARARLTPVGKGSHSPIASNSTDAGRAKNRRVEFVKK